MPACSIPGMPAACAMRAIFRQPVMPPAQPMSGWNTSRLRPTAALANGVSPLALARSHSLVVYQDLITRLNRPGLGPTLSAAAGASYVGHPRMLYGGPPQSAGRIRVPRPWRLGGLQFAASGVTAGQTFVAGAAGDSQRTFGEVIS